MFTWFGDDLMDEFCLYFADNDRCLNCVHVGGWLWIGELCSHWLLMILDM